MNNQSKPHRRSWLKSLYGQLIVRAIACFVIFIIAISAFLYSSMKASLYRSIKSSLIVDAENMTGYVSVWINIEIPKKSSQLRRDNFLITLDKQFRAQAVTVDFAAGDESTLGFTEDWGDILNSLTSNPFVYVSPDTQERTMLYWDYVYADGNDTALEQEPVVIGYAVLGMPLETTDGLLNDMLRGVLGVGALVLIVGFVTMTIILRKPLKPLLHMSTTAGQIASGRYDLRLSDQKGPDEIIVLRDALNRMLDKLDQALRTEKLAREEMARFVANASHELRTPLTSIQGFLEILPRNTHRDPQVLHEAYATMLEETKRLIRLAEALLTLNRLAQSADGYVPQVSYTPYNNAVRELRPLMMSLLQGRVLDWSVLPEDMDFAIPMTRDQLKHVLFNLVTNAIQHTPADGTISIGAHTTGAGMLTISDNGSGIAPEDLPYVFDRFFRSDRSRTHSSDNDRGSGLGLAIVSEIVRLCGGSIGVSSTLGQGTTFVIVCSASDIVPEDLTRLYESLVSI